MFLAKVVLDSISPTEKRLISVEATYPRFIHSELMTHRAFARNAASSRAIPWVRHVAPGTNYEGNQVVIDTDGRYLHPKCMKFMIQTNPVIPLSFDGEQKGMQSAGPIEDQAKARDIWLKARDNAIQSAQELADLGVHKSICNRLTEPFMWITTLITATEWNNFFRLRCHEAAEKHFQKIAYMIQEAIAESKPTRLVSGQWHMPYIAPEDHKQARILLEKDIAERGNLYQNYYLRNNATGNSVQASFEMAVSQILLEVSGARCARLSYLTHDGIRDLKEDISLFNKLIRREDNVIHASPLEHVAQASNVPNLQSGPFRGWRQLRKLFPNENVPG